MIRLARSLRCAALLAPLALGLGVALAHATLVFGELTLSPDPPTPEGVTTWRITLEDPSLTGVEDAIVFLELRTLAGSAEDTGTEIFRERLSESAPARYELTTATPPLGTYQVFIRDQTYPWEEATASLLLDVGAEALGALPFILPPTQVAPRSLATWLAWLIGLPLAAGGLVTLLVLRGARPRARAETA
jgi:hypothetical protein